MSIEGKTKMSMRQRLAYSFCAFGNDAFYGLLSGYLVIFAVMYITMDIFSSFFEDFTLKQKSGAEIKAMDDAMELRVKKGEAK